MKIKKFLNNTKKYSKRGVEQKVKIFGVEPLSSQVFSKGVSLGEHKIQGLADDFVPDLYSINLVDKILQVSDEDAIAMSDKLSKTFGFAVGISSGANFIGAVLSNINGVASVFADYNKKYLSTELYNAKSTAFVEQIELKIFEVI